MKKSKSLEYWKKYGDYIFMATAYQDHVIVEANNCKIKDVDGNEFLDMSSGQICALIGHNHPKLIQKIIDQTKKLLHTGTSFLSPPVFKASFKLAQITPGRLKKSIFLSTGAEANEYAFRIAKAYTGKNGILAFTKGYAGLTLATISATNYGKNAYPLVPETGYILTPDCFNCPVKKTYPECNILCLDVSKEMLKRFYTRTAAIIFEPILSAGGMIVPPPNYFKKLKEFADEIEALLIADEAQTGLGRTGKWFAVEHYDIVPDILVISKGLGGGFPVSAVVTTENIANEVMGKANQFSSHQCDPVAAAAASAVIDIIKEENLIQEAAKKGSYLMNKLKEINEKYPHITNIRGKGLMIGFDITDDPKNNIPSKEKGYILEYLCREKRVHFQCIQKNTFRILPPLTISFEEIDYFISVLEESVKEVIKGKYSLDSTLPKNPYSRTFKLKTRKKLIEKIWETSPKQWVSKVKTRLF